MIKTKFPLWFIYIDFKYICILLFIAYNAIAGISLQFDNPPDLYQDFQNWLKMIIFVLKKMI